MTTKLADACKELLSAEEAVGGAELFFMVAQKEIEAAMNTAKRAREAYNSAVDRINKAKQRVLDAV